MGVAIVVAGVQLASPKAVFHCQRERVGAIDQRGAFAVKWRKP